MSTLLVPREEAAGETRVAATPETVRRYLDQDVQVRVERGAGERSGFSDQAYADSGAELVVPGLEVTWREARVLPVVQAPPANRLALLPSGALVVGLLNPHGNSRLVEQLGRHHLSALALELLPRISRAQSADALSSQANVAGYKAVLLAAAALDRYMPMLMTAAGTVQPARVVVLGAGVAGLQAVATARRLGAIVYVSDIRPAVKEEVESLGARFIEPLSEQEHPSEEGGYAKQASDAFLATQRQQLADQLALADIAICTAQVPGRPAPRLVSEAMLERMRPGAVVVDLAVAQGGNCACSKPDSTVERHGVQIIGANDLPCSVPHHASTLYARNVAALLESVLRDGAVVLNLDDQLIAGSLLVQDGECRRQDIVPFVQTT